MSNPRNWSYSRLTSYECPRRYHQHYVLKAPKTHCSALGQFGTGFHEFAEAYALWCFEQRDPCDLDQADKLASRWRVTHPELHTLCKDWAERDSTRFEWKHVIVQGGSVERWVERTLPNGDLFRGRLDMVLYDPETKHIITHDYKTSWVPPEWDPEKPPFQALCYAWLAMGTWNPDSCIARVEYVRKPSEGLHEWELVPPLDWIGTSLVERIKAVDDENDEMVPGTHCAWCDYLVGCPLEEAANAVLSDPARLGEAFDLAEALSAKASALREPLRAIVNEYGETFLPDGRHLGYEYPEYAGPDGRIQKVKPGMLLPMLKRAQAIGPPPESIASVHAETLKGDLKKAMIRVVERHTKVKDEKFNDAVDRYVEAQLEEFTTEGRAKATLVARHPEPTTPTPLYDANGDAPEGEETE